MDSHSRGMTAIPPSRPICEFVICPRLFAMIPHGARLVHPRAGGEHAKRDDIEGCHVGSSPRGRGTLQLVARETAFVRFIPARAGNTPRSPMRSRAPSVYPRAGGEHQARDHDGSPDSGSSPRGRGTLLTHCAGFFAQRFIPARAGNTSFAPATMNPWSVHPRAGGEHLSLNCSFTAAIGSSPRGRGTRGARGQRERAGRFIPARAGNT